MRVVLIGRTSSQLDPWSGLPGRAVNSKFQARLVNETPVPEELIEFAGRLCYESWDTPNPDTATREGYIANLIKQDHGSVFEHVHASLYVDGVSRNLSHELIRHRHLSFSELSQRYVDMSDANYINPPALRDVLPGVPTAESAAGAYGEAYQELYDMVRGSRKRRREAARYALPSAMETKFVVSGNLRAWRDVLKKRDSEHADAEMQLFAKEVKKVLKEHFPNSFKDL